MTLRSIGFFRELRHGEPAGPSLRELVNSSPGPNETELVSFLRGGSLLATTGRLAHDVLEGERNPSEVLAVLTDGVWMWPSDLAYYVERYHVRLPEDFVNHAARLAWTPPEISRERLIELGSQVVRDVREGA